MARVNVQQESYVAEKCVQLLKQHVIAYFVSFARGVDQFDCRSTKDVTGNQIVGSSTDDAYRMTHRRLVTTIDDRVVGNPATDAVFQFQPPMQRIEDLAV